MYSLIILFDVRVKSILILEHLRFVDHSLEDDWDASLELNNLSHVADFDLERDETE